MFEMHPACVLGESHEWKREESKRVSKGKRKERSKTD